MIIGPNPEGVPSSVGRPSLSVVIPYFQRKPGLLRPCVESVLAQRQSPPCEVIVVDDGSPVPAYSELAGVLRDHPNVQILEHPNAGPGAARNRGLDHVAEGVEFVAFLDSDDRWHPDYATTALAAFAAGCDLFFANSERYSSKVSRFDWRHGPGPQFDAGAHPLIDARQGLHSYDGDFFDVAVYRSSIISTSTLAYRRAKFPHLRFEPRLFNGQDRLFKLQLASLASGATAFSSRVLATEGEGINIFDSSQWGSPKGLSLLLSYTALSKLILSQLPLNESQREFVRGQLDRSRRDFALGAVHLLRRGVALPPGVLRRALSEDPLTLALFVPSLVGAAWRRYGRAA